MFYIHGGGFTSGSGNEYFHGPDYFLDHDVILVTGNYRLGALGFLFNNDDQFYGNYGLKDQVMMLKWIRENIHYFGGNKDKVTIFGDSAGAASIGFHMMSPMSKGLFQQAILQSGTQYNQWALQNKQRMVQNSIKLFSGIGCDVHTNQKDYLYQCMRNKNVYDIVGQAYNLYEWGTDPMVTFGPVIQSSDYKNAFLTQDLYDQKDYWGNSIPVIVGINKDEGAFKFVNFLNNRQYLNDIQNKFDEVMPYIFHYHHFEDKTKMQLNNLIKEFYFKNVNFKDYKDFLYQFIDVSEWEVLGYQCKANYFLYSIVDGN